MKNNFIISIIRQTGILAAIGLLTGCGGDKDYVVDKTIYVNYSSLQLFPGDQVQLQASPGDATFQWTSEDPAVAKVSASGLVEAIGSGRTSIIATSGSSQQSVDVSVTIPTADKITARAGNRRIQLEIDIRSERIKTVKVARGDTGESVTEDVNYRTGIFTVYYPGLPEGKYTFSVSCFDRLGNESPAVEVNSTVYGDTYQSQLKNRGIKAATLFGNGLCIGWADDDSYRCNFSYTGTDNARHVGSVLKSESASYIIGFQSDFKYATEFLPEATAIDTFRVSEASYNDFANKAPVFSASAPCEIQARDFDIGGEGVGYHDSDNTNGGGNYGYRENLGDYNSRGVDVEGGLNLGYTNAGEWLMYTVKVEDAGDYLADMYLSVNNSGGSKYSLEVDGVKTAVFDLNDNGNWGDWRWYHQTNSSQPQPVLSLTRGIHKIKFIFENGGFNFMALKFTRK